MATLPFLISAACWYPWSMLADIPRGSNPKFPGASGSVVGASIQGRALLETIEVTLWLEVLLREETAAPLKEGRKEAKGAPTKPIMFLKREGGMILKMEKGKKLKRHERIQPLNEVVLRLKDLLSHEIIEGPEGAEHRF